MVDVFREVRRILRDDGTLWLNIGDSYAGSWGNYGGQNRGKGGQRDITTGSECPNPAYDGLEQWRPPTSRKMPGIKPKDLIGIPWMLAFALRSDGWYLRCDIIWAKPSPMTESVRDRPTKAHEYMFLLAKSARYFYDAMAIAEPAKTSTRDRLAQNVEAQTGSHRANGGAKTNGTMKAVGSETANKRSVWKIASRSYKGAHFATFPPKLVEPCIFAGTSAKGVCPACGAPWVRETKRNRRATRPGKDSKVTGDALTDGNRDPERHVTTTETVGWKQACKCAAADPVGAIVFDPFAGSGTTLAVAVDHGRRALGTELNAAYLPLIEARMRNTTPALFSEAT